MAIPFKMPLNAVHSSSGENAEKGEKREPTTRPRSEKEDKKGEDREHNTKLSQPPTRTRKKEKKRFGHYRLFSLFFLFFRDRTFQPVAIELT